MNKHQRSPPRTGTGAQDTGEIREYHHAIPRSRWAMSETPSLEALSQRRSISLQPRSQSRLPYVVGGGTGVGRPGVAGAGFGALANSHLRRQMGQVFLLCSHVLMHMRWK